MPTTSPDGIYYADGSTPMSAEDISAAEATSVQAAFGSRQGRSYIWANAAARAAQTGMTAGASGYQIDTDGYWRYDGTDWLPVDGKWMSYRTSSQSIPNSSFTTVTFNVSEAIRGGAVSSESSGSHTIANTGLYRISAATQFAGNASGNRALRIRLGATVLIESLIQSFDTNGRGQSLVLPAQSLTAANTIDIQVFQNSGGSLNLTTAHLVIENA